MLTTFVAQELVAVLASRLLGGTNLAETVVAVVVATFLQHFITFVTHKAVAFMASASGLLVSMMLAEFAVAVVAFFQAKTFGATWYAALFRTVLMYFASVTQEVAAVHASGLLSGMSRAELAVVVATFFQVFIFGATWYAALFRTVLMFIAFVTQELVAVLASGLCAGMSRAEPAVAVTIAAFLRKFCEARWHAARIFVFCFFRPTSDIENDDFGEVFQYGYETDHYPPSGRKSCFCCIHP